MRDALHIFRKDVRCFRELALAVVSLLAMNAAIEAFFPKLVARQDIQPVLQALAALVAAFLIAYAVHQERLVGDGQYWITRPISWRSVMLAKLLLIAVFINVPLWIGQSIALIANGLSPVAYLPALLRNQFLFTTQVSLLATALAAITARYSSFVLMSVVWLTAVTTSNWLGWPGLEWFRSDALALTMFAGVAAILWLQYSRRGEPILPRVLTVALAGVLILERLFTPWHAAFALAVRNSPRTVDSAIARLSYRAATTPHRAGPADEELPLVLYIPVDVAGVPNDVDITDDRARLRIAAAGGGSWDSGWSASARFAGRLENGRDWLIADTDPRFYNRWRTATVDLRASIAFTLREGPSRAIVPLSGDLQTLPDAGLCTVAADFGAPVPVCLSPVATGALVLLRFPAPYDAGPRRVPALELPFDLGAGIWHRVEGPRPFGTPPVSSQYHLEAWRPTARFEREVDIRGVRLTDLTAMEPRL